MENYDEDVIMTEEELDDVVGGGRKFTYDLVHGPKGDYYKCVEVDGFKRISIGADKWDKWVDLCKKRGDSLVPAAKKK